MARRKKQSRTVKRKSKRGCPGETAARIQAELKAARKGRSRAEMERDFWAEERAMLEADPGRSLFDIEEAEDYAKLGPSGFHNIIDAWEEAVLQLAEPVWAGDPKRLAELLHKCNFERLENLIRLAMEEREISSIAVSDMGDYLRTIATLPNLSDSPRKRFPEHLEAAMRFVERLKVKLATEAARGTAKDKEDFPELPTQPKRGVRKTLRQIFETYGQIVKKGEGKKERLKLYGYSLRTVQNLAVNREVTDFPEPAAKREWKHRQEYKYDEYLVCKYLQSRSGMA